MTSTPTGDQGWDPAGLHHRPSLSPMAGFCYPLRAVSLVE